METYHSFELRKWPGTRRRRCAYCRNVYAAVSRGSKYCYRCSAELLKATAAPSPAPVAPELRLDAPILHRVDAHFHEIDCMARDQHGRAMLSPWQLRQHEARAAEVRA